MVKFNKSNAEEKNNIRKDMLAKMRSHDLQERNRKSHEIKRRLFKDKDFQTARSVMFYVSLDYEVNTRDMIDEALKSGKRVIVPVTITNEKRLIPSEITDPETHFHKGAFGIDEPKREYIKAVPVEEIDVIVVPGVAFDEEGNRIGHGKGYFDSFLKDLPKKIPTIGLAFDFQLIDRIKSLPWDVPVTKVITA